MNSLTSLSSHVHDDFISSSTNPPSIGLSLILSNYYSNKLFQHDLLLSSPNPNPLSIPSFLNSDCNPFTPRKKHSITF